VTSGEAVDNRRGAALLIAAAAIFTADVAVLRLLSPEVSNGQVVFFRALSQLVIVAAWIAARNPSLARSPRRGMLVVRGLTSLVCWWLYYASFQALDLALASTLTFTTSLFVMIMAPFALGERIGLLRGVATAFGFLGVVLASGVSSLAIGTGVWLGLGSAFFAATLILQNRVLARTEHTATIMLWIGLVASVGTAPGAILGWSDLTIVDGAVLIVAGSLGTLGMLLTVEAYRFGEVSALAPFPYARILFALLAGSIFFAETVTLRALSGVCVIVVCGLIANGWKRPSTVKNRQ